ncbi:MAG: ATP-binding cassette domain-containing protein, partial [Woeseia sp.]
MSLLKVDNLGIRYGETGYPVVEQLSFALEQGEVLGLVGESGSGKTQSALGIMGLLPPQACMRGSVLLDG